ncbi:serine hydrolase domain-containing protein [Gordonia shandongensis]|uniref:serine hydrolase domain-containing protein n=1 Tax=Gordonia shandongensis TaxID=376351 RepID=UPI0004257AEE|nr:serine hydrolase domain-containing protein [Gordonia shandongensis]
MQWSGSLDEMLAGATGDGADRVPGVVAAVGTADAVLYTGAAGVRSAAGDEPMTTDAILTLYSTTKPITATAVLQCVDDGLIDLDAPAADYVAEIGEIGVLDGYDADGRPRVRPPTAPITTRMLLLHTAGFAYPFFDEDYRRMVADGHHPDIATATRASLATPLLFDPGTRWNYGAGMDWAGRVVEAVRGQRLGEVFAERIFAPLGMVDSAFELTDAMRERRATVHRRRSDGTLAATRIGMPATPELHMGGQGLHGTVGDYLRFLQMWLRNGASADGVQILRPDTVAWAVRDGLADGQRVTPLRGVDPVIACDVEFFPGITKGWAYGFMTTDEQAPTGRSAGSLGWAGLANLYFWIDRTAGVAGMWATQLLPFADPVAHRAALDFETAVYETIVPGLSA